MISIHAMKDTPRAGGWGRDVSWAKPEEQQSRPMRGLPRVGGALPPRRLDLRRPVGAAVGHVRAPHGRVPEHAVLDAAHGDVGRGRVRAAHAVRGAPRRVAGGFRMNSGRGGPRAAGTPGVSSAPVVARRYAPVEGRAAG